MPSRKELVAHGRDSKAIADVIGADLVIFQTLPDLVDSVRRFNPDITHFDCSVFTGDYVTGGVTEEYLQHLEGLRADNMRSTTTFLDAGAEKESGNGGGVVGGGGTAQEALGDSSVVIKADDTVGLHNTFHSQ